MRSFVLFLLDQQWWRSENIQKAYEPCHVISNNLTLGQASAASF